jgi:hypothetical protein
LIGSQKRIHPTWSEGIFGHPFLLDLLTYIWHFLVLYYFLDFYLHCHFISNFAAVELYIVFFIFALVHYRSCKATLFLINFKIRKRFFLEIMMQSCRNEVKLIWEKVKIKKYWNTKSKLTSTSSQHLPLYSFYLWQKTYYSKAFALP